MSARRVRAVFVHHAICVVPAATRSVREMMCEAGMDMVDIHDHCGRFDVVYKLR